MTLFDIYCIFPSNLQISNCNCTMAIELVSNYFIVAVRYLITKFFLKFGDYLKDLIESSIQ